MASQTKTPSSATWLPEFCSTQVVFLLVVAAQLVAIIATLAPSFSPNAPGFWATLGPASVMAQWIALCTAALLCFSRRFLLRLRPLLAAGACALIVLLSAYVCGWLCLRGLVIIYPLGLDFPNNFIERVMALSLLVTLVALRYFYVQQQWLLQVEATAQMQVQALTARIRPHFLFNTLNTATSLIAVDSERAEKVLLDLSELFRAALKSGDQPITLEQELELARGYLAIEQQRLGKRLHIEYDLAQAPLDYRLPPLLLQPLVENAVYHGVQNMLDGGTVRIACAQRANEFELSVTNPVSAHKPELEKRGHGLAQANVRERLRCVFQGTARLEIEANESTYCARLVLPKDAVLITNQEHALRI